MDDKTVSNPIENIMSTTMEKLKQMIDVNVVVGDAVETNTGSTIIPISRVSFGFVAGGGEYGSAQPQLPFAGATGTGVSVNPMGFLVLSDGQVKLLPAQHLAPIDRLIDLIPDLIPSLKSKRKPTPSTPSISPSGKPDFLTGSQPPTTTGMFVTDSDAYITPQNVPCEVCDETDRNPHPTVQGSFEDPKVKERE